MATPVRPAADTYEVDSYAWALGQAALLRARRFMDLDLNNLIEEVEDLAAARLRSGRSRTRTILRHLLKLAYSTDPEPRPGWRATVRTQRADLADDLTPTLRCRLGNEFGELYAQAGRLAAADLTDHAEVTAAEASASTCPFTLEQALDEAWLPPEP
jgi:Domain of unknown function DUF29